MKKILMLLCMVTICAAFAQTPLSELYELREELRGKGLNTARINDSIHEAEIAYQDDPDLYYNISREVVELASTALAFNDRINNLESNVKFAEKYNLTESIFDLFSRMRFEFSRCNYEQAMTYADILNNTLMNLSRPLYTDKINIIDALIKEAEKNNLSISLMQETRVQLVYGRENGVLHILDIDLSDYNESLVNVLAIKEVIQVAKDNNLPTERFKDMLDEAEFYYSRKRIDSLENLSRESRSLLETAIAAQEIISKIKNKNPPAAQLSNIEEEFSQGNFESALAKADKLHESILDREAKEILFNSVQTNKITFDLKKFLAKYWIAIVSIFIVACFTWYTLRDLIRDFVKKKRKDSLIKKKQAVTELIKELQKRYYVEKSISKNEYEHRLDTYQKRLIKIERKL